MTSKSLAVIEALLADGIKTRLNDRPYLALRERRAIAEDAAAVAIARLIDLTGGADHIMQSDGETFTLQHPLTERLTGDLLACEIHDHLAAGEHLEPGRYRVVPAESPEFTLERIGGAR